MNLSAFPKNLFRLVAREIVEITGTIEEIAEELFNVYPDLALKLAHCNQSSDYIDCMDISPTYGDRLASLVKGLCLHDGNEILAELYGECE